MSSDTLDEGKRSAIREQLRQIAESEYFRGSQRCRQLLEYSVNYVVDGRPLGELKERIVGIEVFRKAGDYDTAQDNIVRVTANDVRKRLAQYYGESDQKAYPVFQLPSGSYAVTFRWALEEACAAVTVPADADLSSSPTEQAVTVERPDRVKFNWPLAALGALLAAISLCVGVALHLRAQDLVHRVWAPFLDNPTPVVVCVGEPMAYRPRSNHDIPQGPADQMVPLPGQFVGTGDAYAVADISRYLSSHGLNWTLLARSSTSSETLFNSPTILVGAYSNPWTLALTDNLRFYFGMNNTIYDRAKPGVKWDVAMSPDWVTDHDYAIVSRFISPSTGQPVLIVAGIESYGTRVAAGFVVDQGLLADALRAAPEGWDHRNFELVLYTKIIGNTPARPKVVAAHFW